MILLCAVGLVRVENNSLSTFGYGCVPRWNLDGEAPLCDFEQYVMSD